MNSSAIERLSTHVYTRPFKSLIIVFNYFVPTGASRASHPALTKIFSNLKNISTFIFFQFPEETFGYSESNEFAKRSSELHRNFQFGMSSHSFWSSTKDSINSSLLLALLAKKTLITCAFRCIFPYARLILGPSSLSAVVLWPWASLRSLAGPSLPLGIPISRISLQTEDY